jgi:hypothetical protein
MASVIDGTLRASVIDKVLDFADPGFGEVDFDHGSAPAAQEHRL